MTQIQYSCNSNPLTHNLQNSDWNKIIKQKILSSRTWVICWKAGSRFYWYLLLIFLQLLENQIHISSFIYDSITPEISSLTKHRMKQKNVNFWFHNKSLKNRWRHNWQSISQQSFEGTCCLQIKLMQQNKKISTVHINCTISIIIKALHFRLMNLLHSSTTRIIAILYQWCACMCYSQNC